MEKHKRKCVFFDRDGIVNVPPEPGGYVCRPEDFEVMPEFIESLWIAQAAGYDAVIITNQQGVGKGMYTEQALQKIHAKLNAVVQQNGLELLDLYYCPHHASENCGCRKPKPGMILKAAEKWNIDLSSSWMVGDHLRDVDSGLAAGCQTLLVNPEKSTKASVWIQTIAEMPLVIKTMLQGID